MYLGALHVVSQFIGSYITMQASVLLCALCNIGIHFETQSNLAISISVYNSKSPLFRSQANCLGFAIIISSHLLSSVSNSVMSNSLLFQSDPCSPGPKFNPIILNSMSTFTEKQQNTSEHRWNILNFNLSP